MKWQLFSKIKPQEMKHIFTKHFFLFAIFLFAGKMIWAQCTPGSCGAGLRCVQIKVNTDPVSDSDPTGFTVSVNGNQVASGASMAPSTNGLVIWSGCLAPGDVLSYTLTDGFGDGLQNAGDNYIVVEGNTVQTNDFTSGSATYTYTVVANLWGDDPCSAGPLTVVTGTTCTPSTPISWTGATATSGVPAPGCASYSTGDIWFSAVVPPSGAVFITTAAGTGTGAITDGGMAVYSAASCSGPFTLVSCDDDTGPGSMPQLNLTGLTPGATIYIRFWDYNDATSGNIGGICISQVIIPPGPPNDNPCGAITLPVDNTGSCTPSNPLAWTNATATAGIPAPGCASYTTGDIWYSFKVPASGAVIINTTAGTGTTPITDGGMAAYSSSSNTCAGPFSLILCDDDTGPGNMPQLTLSGLTPGDSIYIRFWDYSDKTTTDFGGICVTSWTPPPPPPNDNPCNATPLTISSTGSACTPSNPISWSNATATSGVPAPGCASYSTGDIWFSVQVPASGNLYVTTAAGTGTGAITDGGMAAYSGACNNLTLISCDDNAGPGSMPALSLAGLAPGSTIYIRFWDYNDATSGNIGGICASDYSSNDNVCSPLNVTNSGGFSANNSLATPDPSNIQTAITNAGITWSYENTLWYYFNASSFGVPNGTLTIQGDANCGSTDIQGALLRLTAGNCSNPTYKLITQKDCVNPVVLNYTNLSASPDTVYILLIDGCAGAICNFTVSGLILPVNVLDFNGYYQNNVNLLHWNFDAQANVVYYELEKSADGTHFSTLATIQVNGNAAKYFYNDRNPFNGNNYYRLKTVSASGQFTYSTILNIRKRNNAKDLDIISVQPNPVKGSVTADISSVQNMKVRMSIMDETGRTIISGDESLVQGSNRLTYDLAKYPAGLYLLQLTDPASNQRIVKKIVKQ